MKLGHFGRRVVVLRMAWPRGVKCALKHLARQIIEPLIARIGMTLRGRKDRHRLARKYQRCIVSGHRLVEQVFQSARL